MASESEKMQQIFNYIKNVRLEEEKQVFNTSPETAQVAIRPDKKISLGMFKPHPFLQETYLAHPTTIRAMKKNLFMAGNDFEELEDLCTCTSCRQNIDRQFWHFCPYCETQLPE